MCNTTPQQLAALDATFENFEYLTPVQQENAFLLAFRSLAQAEKDAYLADVRLLTAPAAGNA